MKFIRELGEILALGITFALTMGLILSCFKGSGMVAAAINFAGAFSIFSILKRDFGEPQKAINIVARAIGIFSLTILLDRIFAHQSGDFTPAIDYLAAHPGEALFAILVGFFCWSLCSTFVPGYRIKPMIVAGTAALAPRKTQNYSKVGPWSKLSEWDAQFIAAHEAGHAVALGLFPYIEKGCHVVLQQGVNADFLDGYCRVNGWRNKSQSRTFLEIDMIILLAGVEAELLCMGERGISATSDHECFIEAARKHLQCDDKSLYFNDPANEHEVKYNTDSILALKLKYQNITRNLLAENREILDEIRGLLVEKGVVRGAELQKLLSGVRWVPGCPIISPALDAAMKADTDIADRKYQEPATA